MSTYTQFTINETGLNEIHSFLAAFHRLGGEHFDRQMLLAWAEGAENEMSEGNTPTIEIRAWDSVRGRVESTTLSDEAFDEVPVVE